jgi:hypothetical protein
MDVLLIQVDSKLPHLALMPSYAYFCRSLWLRFLSIVVFYSQFQFYIDSDRKVNMIRLSHTDHPPWSASQSIVSSDLFSSKSQIKESRDDIIRTLFSISIYRSHFTHLIA